MAERAFASQFEAEAAAAARGLQGTGHYERNKTCTWKHIQNKAKVAATAKAAAEERLKSLKRVEHVAEFMRDAPSFGDSTPCSVS
jgi:hypothetical protein